MTPLLGFIVVVLLAFSSLQAGAQTTNVDEILKKGLEEFNKQLEMVKSKPDEFREELLNAVGSEFVSPSIVAWNVTRNEEMKPALDRMRDIS